MGFDNIIGMLLLKLFFLLTQVRNFRVFEILKNLPWLLAWNNFWHKLQEKEFFDFLDLLILFSSF